MMKSRIKCELIGCCTSCTIYSAIFCLKTVITVLCKGITELMEQVSVLVLMTSGDKHQCGLHFLVTVQRHGSYSEELSALIDNT